jgi:malate dehydrogenase (quinone)
MQVVDNTTKCELRPNAWLPKLKEIIPSYGESLIDDADLCRRIRAETARVCTLSMSDGSVATAAAL